MKKVVIFLIIIFFLVTGFTLYQYHNRTVECWFTILYPQFNYVDASEQYDIETADKVVTKIALVEWLKDVFNFKFLT